MENPPTAASSSSAGGGQGSATEPKCTKPSGEYSIVVACHDPVYGWYDQHTFCYLRLSSPQPPADDPSWAGHKPGDGAIYDKNCFAAVYLGSPTVLSPGGYQWELTPPGSLTPGEAAQIAIAELTMHAPKIGTAPKADGSGLVGMPVWLWTEQSAQTWGTQSATASVPGLSVTATATATAITWDMGDGHQVTCENPGTAYDPSYGGSTSPDCGYVYTHPSGGRPGGVYTITGTTTWQITWVASTGETGSVPPMKLSAKTTVKIGELQAVNH